jgi:hypothetical protein
MTRTLAAATLSLSLATVLAVSSPVEAQQTRKTVAAESAHALSQLPVKGTTETGGTFVGTFDLGRIGLKDGKLVALGTVKGTLRDSVGNLIGKVTAVAAEFALGGIGGSCSILHLELGPLDLDLLGLVVHLNRIVLDITAQPGPGNLLGNLLCAIAGLLDARAPLDILADALNDLLRILN